MSSKKWKKSIKRIQTNFANTQNGIYGKTSEHAADNTRFEEENHKEIDMNVDYRPESRYNSRGRPWQKQLKNINAKIATLKVCSNIDSSNWIWSWSQR